MGEGLGSTRPPQSPASPLHDDDLLSEILLRLPPLPPSLPRASLVCTHWRRLVTDPYFRRRFLARHWNWKPLGFFFRGDQPGHEDLTFTPVSDPRDSVPPERSSVSVKPECREEGGGGGDDYFWEFSGCRHGRVLLVQKSSSHGLRLVLVWNPVSGERQFVAVPQLSGPDWNTVRVHVAVIGASGDRGPFKVALAWFDLHGVHACLYSSESGEWGDVASVAVKTRSVFTLSFANVLVGYSLYWIIFGRKDCILEFDLCSHDLAVVEVPKYVYANHYGLYLSTLAKGGGLSLVAVSGDQLSARIWERTADSGGVAQWMLGGTIELRELLLLRPGVHQVRETVIGLAGDDNVIFVSTYRGVFMVHLQSMLFEKILETNPFSSNGTIHPFTNLHASGTDLKNCSLRF
ncbi:hypothetical protein U9M48_026441 [Paspalum notatum var. saurae]|uniref:F-box domain-containing protein n=1 Tax=Paspalum notatum var. saurae TaxID=547442 RepID=A0AAQ3TWI7_PASNO